MSTRNREFKYAEMLSPFPEGWYLVASRRDVTKARLIRKTWMGESIVVWCDDDGHICVAEAYCPHLGADLGPDSGGHICAGRLVCPFHGYEFDATGQCVATPFAEPPAAAKLRVFETRELLGLVFAWWGVGDRPPQWSLPPDPPDLAGWSDFEMRTTRFPGHPQETTENSVDLAHLGYVHGYENVNPVGQATVDGPRLESRFDFKRSRTIAKFATLTFDFSVNTQVFGLGYSFVEAREHSIGMDLRLWVLATPVDGTLVDLTLVSQVFEIRKPRRLFVGLGFLPVSLRVLLMKKFIAAQQYDDVLQDIVIWSRKRFVPRPRLCRSDGKIMPYREYCAQFYPDPRDPASPQPVAADGRAQ